MQNKNRVFLSVVLFSGFVLMKLARVNHVVDTMFSHALVALVAYYFGRGGGKNE